MIQKKQGGFLISKIHQLAGRIFNKKLRDYGLNEITSSQGRIIFILWQNDEISIQDLARKTSLEKSTLTRMLERLENLGYIMRITSESDRRKTIIKLTSKNEKLKEAYTQVSTDMLDLFYKGLTEHEIDIFESLLNRVYNNLFQFENNIKGE